MRPKLESELSRRAFTRGCAAWTAQTLGRRAVGQSGGGESLPASVRQLARTALLGAFPHGATLCLVIRKNPYGTFTFQSGRWRARDTNDGGDSIEVTDVGSWRVLFRGRFRSGVYPASFFEDGQALYLETGLFPEGRRLVLARTVIDLQTNKASEHLVPYEPNGYRNMHAALGRTLVAAEYGAKGFPHVAIVQYELPDYRETKRTAYATREREPEARETDLFFSPDRRFLACAFDHTVVFRRSEDLAAVWTRQIEPEFLGAWKLSLSGDGAYVAAAVTDSAFSWLERKYYIGVYAGRDGSELTRLRVSGSEAMAISPDGRLLAAGERARGNKGEVAPTAHVYDVSSGRRLASLVHDRVKRGRLQYLNASFNIEFTSDGKYLITSGIDTKVWTLGS